MKIYTRTGDKGQTGLGNGQRVGKDSARVCAYGEIDELNAILGLCRAENENAFLERIMLKIQHNLFDVGGELAMPARDIRIKKSVPAMARICGDDICLLEKWIDEMDGKLPLLKNFILPGGCKSASYLHLARTVCRRAERKAVSLQKKEKFNREIIIYLNRLSDLLFMMARYSNKTENISEKKWVV